MITPDQLAASGTEHGHQAALFCFFQIHASEYPLAKWLYSSSNGFFSTSGQKGKEKAAGLKSGVPDICFPIKKSRYSGLYIELKRPDSAGKKAGELSNKQKEWIDFLLSQDYKVEVCFGWEAARDTLIWYLSLDR